jgi:hypothetical protein
MPEDGTDISLQRGCLKPTRSNNELAGFLTPAVEGVMVNSLLSAISDAMRDSSKPRIILPKYNSATDFISAAVDWFSVTGYSAVIYDSMYFKSQEGRSILDFSVSLKRAEVRNDVTAMIAVIDDHVSVGYAGQITIHGELSHRITSFLQVATMLAFMRHTIRYSRSLVLNLCSLDDSGLACSVLLDYCCRSKMSDVVFVVNEMSLRKVCTDKVIIFII